MLRVRGAPAIGGAAAYGLYLGVRDVPDDAGREAFMAKLHAEVRDYLASSRPTAVNLFWAHRSARGRAGRRDQRRRRPAARLLEEARAIQAEDEAMCRAIGGTPSTLFDGVESVLTHCNAGSLATMGIGTALAPSTWRPSRGGPSTSSPTRPGRCCRAPASPPGSCRRRGCRSPSSPTGWRRPSCARVGSRRSSSAPIGSPPTATSPTRSGPTAWRSWPASTASPSTSRRPSSTIDLATPDGDAIEIEQRDPDEVRRLGGRATAPDVGRGVQPCLRRDARPLRQTPS
jgi:methylthioribose-1-phosphate isomerase